MLLSLTLSAGEIKIVNAECPTRPHSRQAHADSLYWCAGMYVTTVCGPVLGIVQKPARIRNAPDL